MSQTFHFISGLPRSGSTLFTAILRKPRVHAAMTSPVGSLFTAPHNTLGLGNEFADFIDARQRERVLRGIFDLYDQDFAQNVILDTNRLGCARLPLLERLFPDTKLLCTVRNVAWIMERLARLVRKNSLQPSRLFNGPAESDTACHRVEALAGRDRFVGFDPSHPRLRPTWCSSRPWFSPSPARQRHPPRWMRPGGPGGACSRRCAARRRARS